MKNISAGLLMCRIASGAPEYFLVHPGGPFFARKERGYWTIPKGMPDEDEALLEAAQREFREETGITPTPPFFDIGTIRQKGGKIVTAWAFIGEWDPEDGIRCNTFQLEWPPRSGKKRTFPEVDRAAWHSTEEARLAMMAAQVPFLQRARDALMGPLPA